ncbi:MAG: hypothetical protein ACI93R_003304 [Flavobacteriales bacterium]|jgi:hypothetical protein
MSKCNIKDTFQQSIATGKSIEVRRLNDIAINSNQNGHKSQRRPLLVVERAFKVFFNAQILFELTLLSVRRHL